MIPSQSCPTSYNKYGEHIEYDANSNITSLQRYGMLNDRSYGQIDDLSIEYNGNQRLRVTDAVDTQLLYTGASDFVDKQHVGAEYEYNANGALIKDLNRGITNIEYDLLGNPMTITMTNNRSIRYVYSADGRRLRTVHSRPYLAEIVPIPFEEGIAGALNSVSSNTRTSGISDQIRPGGPIGPIELISRIDSTDYFGRFVFHNSHPHQYHFDGGYISFSADTVDGFHYYIQDYMGNNRMVVNGRTDSIEQITHYYPYGGVIGDISTNESLQPYKFEGKELDRTFGLDNYDVEARQYFAMAPMWDRVDPLAEKYYGISPYAYCAGDPVNSLDPTGCYIITRIGIDENYTYCIEKQAFVDSNGEKYTGDNKFLLDLTDQINTLCQYDAGKKLVSDLVNCSNGIYVGQSKKNGESSYSDVYDSNIVSGVQYSGASNVPGGTAYTSLGHEFAHARDRINGVLDESVWRTNMEAGKDAKKAEISATFTENLIRVEHGLPLRVSYYQNIDGSPNYATALIDSKGRSPYYDWNGIHLPGFKRVEKTKRYTFIVE